MTTVFTHGNETRRYVKYDDANMSLYLEVRIPGRSNWIKVRPDEARAFREEKDRMDYQSIKRNLLRVTSNTLKGQALVANKAGGDDRNSNMVPLGSLTQVNGSSSASSSMNREGPMPSTSRGRWIPPPRLLKKSNN